MPQTPRRFRTILYAASLVLLLALPAPTVAGDPVAVGGGNAVQSCDSAHSEVVPGAGSEETSDPGTASADEDSTFFPEYESCLTVAGSCELVTKTSGSTGYIKTGWAISAFFDAGFATTRSDTITTITCEGTYLFTVTYSGGLGIYQGQTTLLTAQTITGDHVDENGPNSKTCSYIGVLGGCSTAHRYEWSGELTFSGEPPENFRVCVKARMVVDEDLLKLPYLSTTGYGGHCFNVMELVVDGDAALTLLDESLATP